MDAHQLLSETAISSSEKLTMSLSSLSQHLNLSKRTLVHWVDRHLIDATLTWTIGDGNEEKHMIALSQDTLVFLETFAEQYRKDVVSCTQARRILKIIDRRRVKKMIRACDIQAIDVDGEKRVIVGSLEDYLRRMEGIS